MYLTVCIRLQIVATALGCFKRHVDVKLTFLNVDIDRNIYILFLYKRPNLNQRNIHLLRKSLCGLKQAPLLWFNKLCRFLPFRTGYCKQKTDSAGFFKPHENGNICCILAFVDDLIFMSNTSKLLAYEISHFLDEF